VTFTEKIIDSNRIEILDISAFKREKQLQLQNTSAYNWIDQVTLMKTDSYLFITKNPEHYFVLEKIKKLEVKPLLDFVDEDGIQRGVSPDLKQAFIVTEKDVVDYNLEKEKIKKVLTGGKQVKRYLIENTGLLLIYTNREDNFKRIPNICRYIEQYKKEITCKEVREGKHSLYSLHRAREERIFLKKEKLIGVITEDEIILALDTEQTFATDGLYLFGLKNLNVKFVMGVLNSKLFVFIYRLISMETGRTLAQVKPTTLNDLPLIYKPDKQLHDEIVKLVDTMLSLNKEKQQTTLSEKLERLQHRIQYTDAKINQLVYQLYGLTEAEIAMVEKS
jgi:CBS domain-containing protein